MSEFRELVTDREAWRAVIHDVGMSVGVEGAPPDLTTITLFSRAPETPKDEAASKGESSV